MRVLTIDTSMPRATVAAVEDGTLVHVEASEKQTAHAERIVGMVSAVLDRSGWGETGTQLIGVGRGPGSFTGVRVGVATAKGWGFARGVPLVGVVSLDAMAHAARRIVGAGAGVAVLDAKKGEVFGAAYGHQSERTAEPVHLPRGEFARWLAEVRDDCCWIVGEVSTSLCVRDHLVVRTAETDLPSPVSIAILAEASWLAQGRDELFTLDPLYVRPPDITLPAVKSTPSRANA